MDGRSLQGHTAPGRAVTSRGIGAALRGEPVPDTVRGRAVRRLRTLWALEALNAVLVPGVGVYLVASASRGVGLPTAAGGVLCALWLVQGAAYWRIKQLQVQGRARSAPLPGWRAFALLRRTGPALLAVGAACWAAPWALGAAGVDVAVGATLWLLAVLEHVNYFHYQLMHDTRSDWRRLRRTRRLRRSFLSLDLDRAAQGSARPPPPTGSFR